MLFSLCLLLITNGMQAATFEDIWFDMQIMYGQISSVFESKNIDLAGDYWLSQQRDFKNILLGTPNKDIWYSRAISATMIRRGFSRDQNFELWYINTCLDKEVKDKIKSYRDTDFNLMPFECTELQCSTNTLGHLYYAGKILEQAKNQKKEINKIIEFGAGYGNLARIFKTLLPQATIILIDLPEFLALQYIFLRSTLTSKIIVHTSVPNNLEEGCIHLLPVYLMNEFMYKPDIFISTFALSEAPNITQKIVVQKSFFNADLIYLSGQLNGWNKGLGFEHHSFLHDAIRALYTKTICHPFHIFNEGFESYELQASLLQLN